MAFTDRLHNRGSISGENFDIAHSASFDDTRNQWLENTMSYVSSRANHQYKKMTLSMWVKRGSQSTSKTHTLWSSASSARTSRITFAANNRIIMYLSAQSGYNENPETYAYFRDHAAWYHIVVRVDTTLSTAADRLRLYVNGIQQTWAEAPDIDQNAAEEFTSFQPCTHAIGGENGYSNSTGGNFDGQIAEVNYMANMSVEPTTFGKFDDNGHWIPIDTTNLSYDAPEDSYRIDFGATDSSNPFNDTSGNAQHFSNGSVSGAPRIGTDTPTNNFCIMNPLTSFKNNTVIYQSGAGHLIQGQSGAYQLRWGTIGINPTHNSSKWYWECKNASTIHSSANEYSWGVAREVRIVDILGGGSQGDFLSGDNLARYMSSYNTGGNGTGANQIWGVMLDCSGSNPVVTLYRDGTQVYTYTYSSYALYYGHEHMFPSCGVYGSGSELIFNFGGGTIQEFTVSSGNTDANGYGNFEYAPPTGALALCSKNLADSGGSYS